jgi:cell division protein FtsI/penicillin-binding protein 2
MRNRWPRAAGNLSELEREMANQMQLRRLVLVLLLLGAAFAGLGYRLVDLQVLRHEEMSAISDLTTRREFLLQPRRGNIVDARGTRLATSVFVKTICADPSLMGDRQPEVVRAIAPLLQMRESDLLPRLARFKTNDQGQQITNRYVVLKRKVPFEVWDKVQAAMTNLSFGVEEKKLPKAQRDFYTALRQHAVFTETVDDQQRVYPNQTLAAHVLGYVGVTEMNLNGRPVQQTQGADGIEKTFDVQLSGVRGLRRTETDSRRRELGWLRSVDVEPRDGCDVVLTIDSVVQHILEEALAEGMQKHNPVSISGVVVRPRTGEILAMATLPTFDPNNPGASTPDARRNRIITDAAEPGSTFKIVVVSGALNDGTVKLADTFDCEHGHFSFAGKVLHDHEPYDVLDVQEIIMKSSNIGAAKIGIRMGDRRLYEYIQNFGFGATTGLPLPGEVSARPWVPAVSKWSKLSIARIPMGQGIATTRMQMVMTMCTIANKGVMMRPMLVKRLEDGEHNVVANYEPMALRRVISEAAAHDMVQALKTVVSADGTAAKAALDHYTAAGKTGTAEKVENGRYVSKFFSSFIGFFPADNPELCIAVSLDEPKDGHYGGSVAGPVFKQIAENAARYLSIPPEDGADLPMPTNSITGPLGGRSTRASGVQVTRNP